MTCPRCETEFDAGPGRCPRCGTQLVRNVSGVMKTSAVMIASGDEHGFYRSVQDVPEPLRTQLIEITNGSNSGTIVIADRAGKEQITRVIARRDRAPERTAKPAGFNPLHLPWIAWAGALLVLAAAGIITAVFVTHW
jgi:hypothetical protein